MVRFLVLAVAVLAPASFVAVVSQLIMWPVYNKLPLKKSLKRLWNTKESQKKKCNNKMILLS